jgi:hypothetical protein
MGRVQRNLLGILVAVACGLLGACRHASDGSAALVKRHAGPSAGGAGANGADQGPTDLVSAVSLNGTGDGAVSLKFQLGQRPVAGQPVVIVLRLVANQPLEHLEARFHADDGLEIPQGGDFDPEGHLDPGATVDHSLTVVPAHDGVFTVMATVTAGSATAALSRSFVIPIVVGPAGPPPADAVAAKPH